MKLLLFCFFAIQLTFSQTLLPVYQGKIKPKFELVWEISDSDEFMLSEPRKLTLDKDGNLYFAEYGDCIIRKFDKDGKFIKSIGRKGEGPGEFKNCRSIDFDKNGNYYIYDVFLRRVNIFNSNDEFVKSIKSPNIINELYIDESGQVVLHYDKNSPKGDYVYGKHFSAVVDEEFKVVKNLDSLEIKEMKISKSGKNVSVMGIVYGPRYNLLPLKNGNAFVTNSEDYVVKIFSPSGELLSSKTIGKKREPVREKDKEKVKARYNDGGFVRQDMLEFNTLKPFYASIFQDREGFILAQKYTVDNEEEIKYDVFSPDGELLNEVSLPFKYFNDQSVVAGEFIIVNEETEDELPVIRKYKIVF